ncbi:hypothetical protein GQ54DRAFT_222877 [Martensiomyces pterosporus]|nr:hypothetical protein GQ54DRAFT_222877 [Martensiomyces pterosporus]
MADQEQQNAIAAGLQRQLDELREIIHQGGSNSSGGRHDDSQQPRYDAATVEKLMDENARLCIRISHLLRALDSRDQPAQDLQTKHC